MAAAPDEGKKTLEPRAVDESAEIAVEKKTDAPTPLRPHPQLETKQAPPTGSRTLRLLPYLLLVIVLAGAVATVSRQYRIQQALEARVSSLESQLGASQAKIRVYETRMQGIREGLSSVQGQLSKLEAMAAPESGAMARSGQPRGE